MKIGKRGIEKATLVILIVGFGIIITHLFINKEIASAGERSAEVSACRVSVERNARLHLSVIEFPTSLNCPANEFSVKDEELANEQVANAMYDCWNQYAEGKLNLFSDEETFCGVCSLIDVRIKSIDGLPAYLHYNEIPDGSGRLYSDYLTGFETSRAEQVLGEANKDPVLKAKFGDTEDTLPGERMYAVLFVYAKGNDELEKLAKHLKAETFQSKAGLTFGILGGLSVGSGVAGASALVGLLTVGAVTGPPGWIIIGTSVAVGATAGYVSSFFASPDLPQWAAFTVLREWDSSALSDLGCTYWINELE